MVKVKKVVDQCDELEVIAMTSQCYRDKLKVFKVANCGLDPMDC